MAVRDQTVYSDTDPQPHEERRGRDQEGPGRAARRLLKVLGWAAAVVAIAAGVGWLYLLDGAHLFALGPNQRGALPLEELARRGAQPLARMVVAWVPTGAAAAIALVRVARTRSRTAVVAVGVLAFAILFPTTAGSEALERNERLSAHVGHALGRPGVWVAVVFAVIGSLAVAAAESWRRSDRGRAATAPPADGSEAA
ncbi:MAG: hypothetical protein JOZ25_10945 [Actinobacteria bacterium]|nr:hypothetical protein [Actinomycetota bacterium]